MPDDTPAKLGMAWAVDMSKPWFVGKRARAHGRAADVATPCRPRVHRRADDITELRGEPLIVGGAVVGRITSAERSIALDRAIGLGWVRAVDGGSPIGSGTGGGSDRDRGADAVLRPGRRTDAWLSCGSSSRRSSRCSRRATSATSSSRPMRPHCSASPPRGHARRRADASTVRAVVAAGALVEDVSDAWVSFVLEGPDAQRRSLGSPSWSCRRSAGSRARSPTPPRRCSSSPTSSRSSCRRWSRPTSSTVSAPMRRRCSTRERPLKRRVPRGSATCGRATTS